MHAGQKRLKGSTARFRVAMFGRRWGKNVLGIEEAMDAASHGQVVGWFEPTYKYVLEAWRDLVNRLRPLAKHVDEQQKRLELLNGGIVEAWTCDTPDPARGRAYDLVIVNEAGIIRNLLPIWQEAIRPTLTDRKGRALFMGTPKGRTHDFSQLFSKAQGATDWEAFRGPTSENPYIPQDEIEAAKADLPPAVFAQEFEGIPADDGGNPFGLDAIKACTTSKSSSETVHCFGWDFARAQDWTVGIGLSSDYQVVKFHRWQLIPWGEQKHQIHELNGPTPAWGDSTAMGGDVIVEDLQRMGVPMIGVPFSRQMKQKLMERLAVAIQQRKLRFPEGPISSELETFQYEYTDRGVRYSAPDGMHDDCVMALALAVFGRDQFGEIPELQAAPAFEEDRHPGFEMDKGHTRRKKPWERGWQPEKPDHHWIPNKDLTPL